MIPAKEDGRAFALESVALYGSNSKSSRLANESIFYRQLDSSPDALIEGMLNRLDRGIRRFDNLDSDVEIVDTQLITASVPSLGFQRYEARLLLGGNYMEYGMPNPQPWTSQETIVYATVSGNIWTPESSRAVLTLRGDSYNRMDSLYWYSLTDQPMHQKVSAVMDKNNKIRRQKADESQPSSLPMTGDIYQAVS